MQDQLSEKYAIQKNIRSFFKSFLPLFSSKDSPVFFEILQKLSPLMNRLLDELIATEASEDNNFYIISMLMVCLTSVVFPEQQITPIITRMKEKTFLLQFKKKCSHIFRNQAFFREFFDCIVSTKGQFVVLIFPAVFHSVVEIIRDNLPLTPFSFGRDLLEERCFLRMNSPFSLYCQAEDSMFSKAFKVLFSAISCISIEPACLETFFQLIADAIKKICFETCSTAFFQFKSISSQLELAARPLNGSLLAQFCQYLNSFYSSFIISYLFLRSLHLALQEYFLSMSSDENSRLLFEDPAAYSPFSSLKFGLQKIENLLLLEQYHVLKHFCPKSLLTNVGMLEPKLLDFAEIIFNNIEIIDLSSLDDNTLQSINYIEVVDQLKGQLRNSKSVIDQLSSELDKKTVNMVSLEQNLIEHQSLVCNLSAQNEASANLLEENSILISDLRSELKQKELMIGSSDVELAGLEEKVCSLQSLNRDLVEELEKIISAKECLGNELEKIVSEKECLGNQLEKVVSEKQFLINQFEAEKNNLLNEFTLKLEEKSAFISNLEKELERSICENRALTSQHEAHLEAFLSEKSSNENLFSVEIGQISSECDDLKVKISHLERKVLLKEEAIVELKALDESHQSEVRVI